MNSPEQLMEGPDKYKLLGRIDSPSDFRDFNFKELEQLAHEIRQKLVEVISVNGGHLAPNLGVVELTLALHYTFNTPIDKLIWDVGHQAYVHKILTGRREQFETLRQDDGCLGFLHRDESEYDVFGAGHAGTAISAALGMAAARDRLHNDEKIIAVVGDGSLNCGISLEGLNNVAETTRNLIIVLNDNKMSISQNVGAIPNYLNRIISGRGYNRFKALAKVMVSKIPHGEELKRKISKLEEATKSIFVPGVFFEELGLRYIGPIPGHNLPEMIRTLEGVKEFHRPVIVHVLTEKGHGYHHAENSPEHFHGLSSFNPDTGKSNGKSQVTFSSAFGDAVVRLAEEHDEVVAITAAMGKGTGLTLFEEKFPDRFFDVGIAEEHALVFAAGLVAGGLRPVVAIYATFLQRALDCVFHDICLQKLPVIICTDRAGIVDDGPTHHGIHDMAFLRNMPNLAIMAPKDELELEQMLLAAYKQDIAVVIRYPRGGSGQILSPPEQPEEIEWGKAEVLKQGKSVAIWALGHESWLAIKVAEILQAEFNIDAEVVNVRFMLPFDQGLLFKQAEVMPIVTIEDCQVQGGLGSTVDELLINRKNNRVLHFGWGNEIIRHGTVAGIKESYGLTPDSIASSVAKFCNGCSASETDRN